jgi:outer membrane receptor protein involved in Fe transport
LTAAQCANTGVTPEQYGNITASPAGQYNAQYGGSPDLDVETAKTFTAGIVIVPTDTMQISVDYWSIKIDDTISFVAPETSVGQCGVNGGALCDNIHRGNGGTLWLGTSGWVTATNLNIGTNKWSGIDLAWAWTIGDHWNLDLIGSYSLEREITPLPNDPTSAYDCAGVISPSCVQVNGFNPNPDWRHTATATYDSTSWWALTARWRYLGSVDYPGTTDLIVDDNTDAQNYFDLNAVFRFMDTHDVVVGVNNVFDEEPPMIGSTIASNGNTMVGFYDTLGRYFFADLTLRW